MKPLTLGIEEIELDTEDSKKYDFTGEIYHKFFKNIEKNKEGCWVWTASKDTDGYGQFSYGNINERRAHRAAYKLFIGEIPEDLLVRHSCHNPSCCNPEHLKVGTPKDNSQDCVDAGRSGAGFKNGRCKICPIELQYIINQQGKIPIYKIWKGEHKYEI